MQKKLQLCFTCNNDITGCPFIFFSMNNSKISYSFLENERLNLRKKPYSYVSRAPCIVKFHVHQGSAENFGCKYDNASLCTFLLLVFTLLTIAKNLSRFF